MTSLYQLTADFQRLLMKDDLTDEDLASINDSKGLIEDKAISCACVITELKGKLAFTKEAIKVAQDKYRRLENNIERLENYVLNNLIINGIEKIDKHPLFDITLRINPVSVEDYDPQSIPLEYFTRKEILSLDRKKVKEDIENLGLVIPGVKLTRKISLRIG